jgi:hypothetical protein
MIQAANIGAFRQVSRCRANGLIDVAKYVSAQTGLTVTVADVVGPMLTAKMCLGVFVCVVCHSMLTATETITNDGLPHTLEHLVFMGSQKYSVKGLLDLAANRCLASGTNAYTEQDHTCYELKTAGAAGFTRMLPVFLDHIFRPLLTVSVRDVCNIACATGSKLCYRSASCHWRRRRCRCRLF